MNISINKLIKRLQSDCEIKYEVNNSIIVRV